jgi:hypothetical protein
LALGEWISSEADNANTHWRVADNSALSVSTARARARISALLIDASLVAGTFIVAYTLRSAVGWCSDEIGQARA